MPDLRGRPYAFLALTISCWIGARLILPIPFDAGARHPSPKVGLTKRASGQALRPMVRQHMPTRQANMVASRPVQRQLVMSAAHIPKPKNIGLPPALVAWQVGGRPSGLSTPLRVAGDDKPVSAGWDTPPTIAHTPVGKAGSPEYLRPKRWNVYAYSFWRASKSRGPIAGSNAQYGGSQSGIIATLDPFGSTDRGVALLMRGSVMPVSGGATAHEAGFGLRWRPNKDWPFTLTAERRFRDQGPDDFAAYVAGGANNVALIKGWTLNAFGQAGYATGPSGGGFFDAQARAMRSFGKLGSVPLSAGVGSWTGGQKGVRRLDIGPTIVATFDAAPAVVLVQLDWRLRIAGNGEPKSGFALTVSTGF